MAHLERLAPDGLADSKPFGFTQVVRTRGTQVWVSGQVAIDTAGKPVAIGDLEGQARQAMTNLGAALAGAGAGWDDVAKLNLFIVDFEPAKRDIVGKVRDEFIDPARPPASTLLGVQALAHPVFQIEIEAVAVVGDA